MNEQKSPIRIELEEKLAKIGWRISESHNGLNHWVINHMGERTGFVLTEDDKLEVRTELFGSSFKGVVHIDLSEITIKEGKSGGNDIIDYICLNITKKNFISFFNHEIFEEK